MKTIQSRNQLLELTDHEDYIAILFIIDNCEYCDRVLSVLKNVNPIQYQIYQYNVSSDTITQEMYSLIEFPTLLLLYGTLIKKMSIGVENIEKLVVDGVI